MRWPQVMEYCIGRDLEIVFSLFDFVLVEVGSDENAVEAYSLCMKRQYLLYTFLCVFDGFLIVTLLYG